MLLNFSLSIYIKENLPIEARVVLFKNFYRFISYSSENIVEYGICTNSLEFVFIAEEDMIHLIKEKISNEPSALGQRIKYELLQKCS